MIGWMAFFTPTINSGRLKFKLQHRVEDGFDNVSLNDATLTSGGNIRLTRLCKYSYL